MQLLLNVNDEISAKKIAPAFGAESERRYLKVALVEF
jgi:hypothetical protein